MHVGCSCAVAEAGVFDFSLTYKTQIKRTMGKGQEKSGVLSAMSKRDRDRALDDEAVTNVAPIITDELRAEVRTAVFLRLAEDGDEVADPEREWLQNDNLDIYLSIREPPAAIDMIVAAVKWRLHRRDLLLTLECPKCREEPRSHDARMFGTDPEGDVVFMNCFALPRELSPKWVTNHMACLMERAIRRYPRTSPEHLKWTWIIDTHGFNLYRYSDPRTTVQLLNLLQVMYPDRLKKLLIVDVPLMFWGFYKVVSPFIDPVTKAKIHFITGSAAAQSAALAETFDLATWEASLGGELPFMWDAEAYFGADPQMGTTAKEAPITVKP